MQFERVIWLVDTNNFASLNVCSCLGTLLNSRSDEHLLKAFGKIVQDVANKHDDDGVLELEINHFGTFLVCERAHVFDCVCIFGPKMLM